MADVLGYLLRGSWLARIGLREGHRSIRAHGDQGARLRNKAARMVPGTPALHFRTCVNSALDQEYTRQSSLLFDLGRYTQEGTGGGRVHSEQGRTRTALMRVILVMHGFAVPPLQ